jgi:hypothetical protein
MSKVRPSPSVHASEQKIGTCMKGNDGNIYVIKERVDGTKYWMKTRLSAQKKPTKIVGKNKIIFNTFELSYNYKKYNLIVNISDSFLEILNKKPKYIVKNQGNAYIFGKLFDSGYHLIDKHGTTGDALIINVTKFNDKDVEKVSDFTKVIQCFSPDNKIKTMGPWDNRKSLKKVQTIMSDKILFVGDIKFGNGDAYYYCHFNSKNEIDSLIIDNECLFKDIC